MRLAPETIDGLLFEWQLESNPILRERRERRNEQIRADSQLIAGLSRAALIDGLIAHYPAYVRELLEKSDDHSLRDRVVMTLQGDKARPSLLRALGLE